MQKKPICQPRKIPTTIIFVPVDEVDGATLTEQAAVHTKTRNLILQDLLAGTSAAVALCDGNNRPSKQIAGILLNDLPHVMLYCDHNEVLSRGDNFDRLKALHRMEQYEAGTDALIVIGTLSVCMGMLKCYAEAKGLPPFTVDDLIGPDELYVLKTEEKAAYISYALPAEEAIEQSALKQESLEEVLVLT